VPIRRAKRLSVVARADSELLGYLCLWEIGHEIHVTNLATPPDVRRHGVALGRVA